MGAVVVFSSGFAGHQVQGGGREATRKREGTSKHQHLKFVFGRKVKNLSRVQILL